MPQINAGVSQQAYDAAKESAGWAGMKMKKWIERALIRQAELERPTGKYRELRHEPVDER